MKMLPTTNGGLWIKLSAKETYDWATLPGNSWPCSKLSGKRLFVQLDANGDLVDLSVNGRSAPADLTSAELDAILGDLVG